MAGKEHVISMEDIFRRKVGETSNGAAVIEVAQTESMGPKMKTIVEARKKMTSFPGPKIQKVISLLRDQKDFQNHYEPRVVSLGPIHHGNDKYQLGEHYKLVWTYEFVEGSEEKINYLYEKIEINIGELSNCYVEEVTKNFDEKDLIWMFLVDGCAIY